MDVPVPRWDTVLGLPAPQNLDDLYDLRDLQAACLLYQWGLPIVAMARLERAVREVVHARAEDVGAFVTYAERRGILTPNTITPYYITCVDLSVTGPIILDVPDGPIAGGVTDFWQRHITDIGPDGGRHVVTGPGHSPPDLGTDVRVAESRTNNIMCGLRILTPDADGDLIRRFRVRRFDQRDDPPPTRVLHPDGTTWFQAQPAGLDYFRELAAILAREPVEERDRFFAGIAATLGIRRERPFEPGERVQEILTEAARLGEAFAQATAYAKRFPTATYRPDSRWTRVANVEPSHVRDGLGQFFERAAWFYEATGMSEGMAHPTPGSGQGYLGTYTDGDGDWLDGGRAYTLRVPADPPARQFWSVCVYDALDRTLPGNPSQHAELSSRDALVTQPDGSVIIHFGPDRPAHRVNWIQTVPGRPWFAYLRLYAPTEPYFDRTWPLPDIEPAH
ncbi:DUF1214 domain-containing protein [Actinomadura harenae]|uniref:DUF1254 domain-containing protein n=1 Tax=Actinomadura harenae TaxID=2483351 RepID=A0A3M2LYJ5_9ACTN|nr:DUF1214 domain-containing protein [Actinomadura harenae]RMI42000.1 DUF1254 domain-containing protein [Actinomadura harenae]